jgi:hypothetical protein
MIAFNVACYASVTGRMEGAKVRPRHDIKLDRDIRLLPLDDQNLKSLWDWIESLELHHGSLGLHAVSPGSPIRQYFAGTC